MNPGNFSHMNIRFFALDKLRAKAETLAHILKHIHPNNFRKFSGYNPLDLSKTQYNVAANSQKDAHSK